MSDTTTNGQRMIKDEKLPQVISTLQRLASDIFSDAIQRKLILDNLTEGVFTVDPDLRITSFNHAAERITGISEREATGKFCRDLFHSAGDEEFCLIGQAIGQGAPVQRLMRQLSVQGHCIPVLVSASPLVNAAGILVGAIQSFQEITEIFHRQLILDSIFDGVFTVDLDGRVTLFNKAAEKLTGYGQHEVLGRIFSDLLRLDRDAANAETALARAMATGKPASEECVYLGTKDGRILPISVSAAPLIDARGRIFGGVETFRDNTDRIQTDLILDHVVDGVITVDPLGMITSCNKAAVRLAGLGRGEVLGKPWQALFAAGNGNGGQDDQRPGLPRPEQWIDKRFFLKHKDDRGIPVSMSSVPMTGKDRRVLGKVQTFRDITNQLENQYILDSVADGVFTVDHNFFLTSFNKAAEQITGYRSDEVLGRQCCDIFCAALCAAGCPLDKAIKTGVKVRTGDVLIEGKAGNKIPVSISSTALMDETGTIIGGVETFKDLTEVTSLRRQLSAESQKVGIVSRSPKIQRILAVLPEFARSESTILILGESGTGKELIANAIHNLSPRQDKPFVAVNSGALPDTLLESELFGYKAGAFTDARKDRKGRFAAAEGGTLFLDEIGDISPAMQVKLLRVLQTRMYEPLGSNTPAHSDVRIITATNKNLEKMVAAKGFREDLYYRLNVVKIELPPLRERMEDLPIFVEHFVQKFNWQRSKNVRGISDEALDILLRYNFPGNIRELENIIEYAFILCHDVTILPQHLPETFFDSEKTALAKEPCTLAELEKKVILEKLGRNNFMKMKTCRELGISKDTLRRKLKSYGLDIN